VGVRQYYDSQRAIDLISGSGPLPENQFHTPFVIWDIQRHQRVLSTAARFDRENTYMMQLAGIVAPNGERYASKTPLKAVMDFGCGLGKFAAEIARTGCCEVWGVNIAANQVKRAQETAATHYGVQDPSKLHFKVYDGRLIPFQDGELDIVFFQESFSTSQINVKSSKKWHECSNRAGRLSAWTGWLQWD